MVPAECLERTVRVNVPGAFGSGFTIDRHGREWLVTAGHVVQGVDIDRIEVRWRGRPAAKVGARVPSSATKADIATFELAARVAPSLALHPASTGAVFGQQAYFLGYPFGLGNDVGPDQFPFVKGAIISARVREGTDTLWYLDGMNNPGFSGGPVVFRCNATKHWHVAGVVSGYRIEPLDVEGGFGHVLTNTGIIAAYDVRHAVEAIDAFVGA